MANHAGLDRLMQFSSCADASPMSGTWYYAWTSDWPDEDCLAGGDADADGLAGCADPDCDERPCAGGICAGDICQ